MNIYSWLCFYAAIAFSWLLWSICVDWSCYYYALLFASQNLTRVVVNRHLEVEFVCCTHETLHVCTDVCVDMSQCINDSDCQMRHIYIDTFFVLLCQMQVFHGKVTPQGLFVVVIQFS